MILERIKIIPIGYSEVYYQGEKYGLTRTDFNNGKSLKLYARALGGKDFISCNYYITQHSEQLKPCEMPEKKVAHFLNNFKLI